MKLLKDLYSNLLAFYHSLPPKVRAGAVLAGGTLLSFGHDAWNKYEAAIAAHQANSFDWHQVAVNAITTSVGVFIAAVIPFHKTSIDAPQEGAK